VRDGDALYPNYFGEDLLGLACMVVRAVCGLTLGLCRYKMICAVTWPNFKHGSDRYGTQAIIDDCRAGHDVQYGKTKIFIRSPQTLFELEKRRTDKIPSICVTLQKVG